MECSVCGQVIEKSKARKEIVCEACYPEWKKGRYAETYKKWREENPEYDKKRYDENPEKIKEQSKKYREKNPEKVKEQNRKYKEENAENIKAGERKHYEENCENIKERSKKYREVNPEKVKEKNRKWREENPEYNKKYRKSPAGKATKRKANNKRRAFGFNPINEYFEGSEYHHLHYDQYGNEDRAIGLFIPAELHRSIYHDSETGQGIKEIEAVAWKWYQGIFIQELLAQGEYENSEAWL
jgi:hypothetical protein